MCSSKSSSIRPRLKNGPMTGIPRPSARSPCCGWRRRPGSASGPSADAPTAAPATASRRPARACGTRACMKSGPPRNVSIMWPMIGNPASPMTGLRSLPGGGSASVICFHSWTSSRFSSAPSPGRLFTVGINRRFAWSSRYSGVLIVAIWTLLDGEGLWSMSLCHILAARLDACQVLFWRAAVQWSTAMTAESAPGDPSQPGRPAARRHRGRGA